MTSVERTGFAQPVQPLNLPLTLWVQVHQFCLSIADSAALARVNQNSHLAGKRFLARCVIYLPSPYRGRNRTPQMSSELMRQDYRWLRDQLYWQGPSPREISYSSTQELLRIREPQFTVMTSVNEINRCWSRYCRMGLLSGVPTTGGCLFWFCSCVGATKVSCGIGALVCCFTSCFGISACTCYAFHDQQETYRINDRIHRIEESSKC